MPAAKPATRARPRARASAKAAGARFARQVADYLRDTLSDFIDKQPLTGAKDLGDIANVRTAHGHKVAVEVKNTARLDLPGFVAEAEAERINLGAIAGVVISKRHGNGDPGEQWVHMTVRDFVALLKGERP